MSVLGLAERYPNDHAYLQRIECCIHQRGKRAGGDRDQQARRIADLLRQRQLEDEASTSSSDDHLRKVDCREENAPLSKVCRNEGPENAHARHTKRSRSGAKPYAG